MAPEISYSVQPTTSMTALERQTSLLDDLRSKHGKQANDGSSSTINGTSSQHTGTTSNTTLSGSRSSLLPTVGNGLSKTVGSALNAAAVSSRRLMQFNTTSFTQDATAVERATQVQSAPATPTGSSKVVSSAHIRKLLTNSSLLPNLSGHGSVGSNSTGLSSMGSHHLQKPVHPTSNSRLISGKISEQAEKVNGSIHTMIANLPQFAPPTSLIPKVFSSSSFPTNAPHTPPEVETETTDNEGDDDTTCTDMDESSRKSHKNYGDLVRTDTDESLLKTPSPKKSRVRRREQRQKSPRPRRTSHSPMPSRSRPLNPKSPSNNMGSTNRAEEKLGKISPPFADHEKGHEEDRVCESPIGRTKKVDTIHDNESAGQDTHKARRPHHKSKHGNSAVQGVKQRQQRRHEKKRLKARRASKKQKELSRTSATADTSPKSLLDEEPPTPEPSEPNPYTATGAYDIEEDEDPSPPPTQNYHTSTGTKDNSESVVKQPILTRVSSAPVKLTQLPQQVVKYDDDEVSLDWRDFARAPEKTKDPPPKPPAPTEPAETEEVPDKSKQEKQGNDSAARGKIVTSEAPVITRKPRRMTQEVLSVRRASRRGRSKSARDVNNIDNNNSNTLSARRGQSQRELSSSRRSKSPSTFRRCKSQTTIQARDNRPREQRSASTSRRDMDESATSQQADKSHRRRKSRERVSARATEHINPDREKRKSSHERRHRQRSSSLASRQRRKSKCDRMGNSSETNQQERYSSRRRERHRDGDKHHTDGEDLASVDKNSKVENEPNKLRPPTVKSKSCNGIDVLVDDRPKHDSEAENSALGSSGEHGGYGWGILSALGHRSSTTDTSPRENEGCITSHHENGVRHTDNIHVSRTRRESRTRRSSETRRASLLDDRSERSHRRRSTSTRRKNQKSSSTRMLQDKSATSVRSLQVDTLVKDRSNRRMGDSSRRKSERLDHSPTKHRLNEAMDGSEKSHSRVNKSRKAMDSSEQSYSRAPKSRLAVDPMDKSEKTHKRRSSRRTEMTDRSEKSHKSRSSRRVAEAIDGSEKNQSRVMRPSLLGDVQDHSRRMNEYSGDQIRPLRRPSNEGIIL